MKICYDPVLKRPGCVLLQAAYGCETWLLAPTPDMGVYEVTDSQLAALVRITVDANK